MADPAQFTLPAVHTQDAVWLSLHQAVVPPPGPGHYLLAMLLTLLMLVLSASAAVIAMVTRITPYIGALRPE